MAGCETGFVVVLCTGQLIKLDMAVNALEGAGIAYQMRAETATGLKVAMPVTPAAGPGRFFTLLVPACAEPKAKLVLSSLPFEVTTNPGPWDFEPQPTVKRWWRLVIIGMLVWLVAYWIIEFLRCASQ